MNALSRKLAVLCLVGLTAAHARALGPHEVLLLVNDQSVDSVEIGRAFTRLRGVPTQNVVSVSLPEKTFQAPLQITPEAFTDLIWRPATDEADRRGISDHILAWVYSVDFPTRVSTAPMLSVQGLTFLRNRLPKPETVKHGSYPSPLFAGPNNPRSVAYRSQTLEVFSEWLRDEMPLPSMMLGYTRVNGNTKDEVLECLQRGAESDFTAPRGMVYFVTNGNVRSTARDWQFPSAVKALAKRGVKATSLPAMPSGRHDIVGLMTGAAVVDPGQDNVYLPGSIGEHFTSWAGCFDRAGQTKLTVWIAAGAVASAGTVVEPYANWQKFPSGWLFVHYASGCCVLESFYQALRCPLQTIVVGDPLAQPWAPRAELEILGIGEGTASGILELQASARGKLAHYLRFVYLLDGRVVGKGKRFSLDTRKVQDGRHLLRVVGYRAGAVRSQVYDEKPIIVSNVPEGNKQGSPDSRAAVRELISHP